MDLSKHQPNHNRIVIILQAAGNSTRFGSNKLLHIMEDGRPMICSILDAVRDQDISCRILVTQYPDVAALVPDFKVVMNDAPALGISHSMQLGIEAAGDAEAYMFCVCDQPHLSAETISKLVEAYYDGSAGIVSLAWNGKMYSPKIFSSRYRDELMAVSGDTGGRQIIANHMEDLLLVEAADEREVADIDTPYRLWNYRGEQYSISEALQITLPEQAVISIVGAGGKTTLLTAWARELASSGKRTVVTTTTHMLDPRYVQHGSYDPYQGIPAVILDHPTAEPDTALLSQIDGLLDKHQPAMVISADPDRPGKVKSLPSWVMEHICKTADAVLIEADGSRRHPLKWPAPWEPVVPDNTDITVCVAGLSAFGKPLREVMYRADDLPDRLFRETVDETLITAVLASLDGGQKGSHGEFRVFLNQADNEDLRKIAARLQQILGVQGIQSAWGMLRTDI
ncbi:MAG: putative selenium-dependent hydroxylase accessory protein YqeC [Mogibacterium sp.]|nr:putative selenium-dependent hydroxylase accessory protein YqeC [Mogibacterium sp.]